MTIFKIGDKVRYKRAQYGSTNKLYRGGFIGKIINRQNTGVFDFYEIEFNDPAKTNVLVMSDLMDDDFELIVEPQMKFINLPPVLKDWVEAMRRNGAKL